jgi:hypothetical protein
MDFPKCTREYEGKTISLSDPKSKNSKAKLTLKNPNQLLIKVIDIDGCVITEGIRCDQLVILPSNKLIYIEFKGNDVNHAVKQIEETIRHISRICRSSRDLEMICMIACSRCPLSSTDIQKQKRLFRNKYRSQLLIKTGAIEYTVEA